MRAFNKVVTVIGLLLAFVLLPVVAAIPAKIVAEISNAGFSVESWLNPGAHLLLVAAVAAVLWLVVLMLLWLEFRPGRTVIKVTAVEGGEATVTADSVARHLEQSLAGIPAVREVRARVRQERDGVAATLLLRTGPDVNVPSVTAATISRARDVLESHIGARVSRVSVQVQHGAATARRDSAAAATAPVTRLEPTTVGSVSTVETAPVQPAVWQQPSAVGMLPVEPVPAPTLMEAAEASATDEVSDTQPEAPAESPREESVPSGAADAL